MGVVIKQSFWVSFLTYVGVILGYISSLLLFPTYLDVDQIGLIRLIQSNGLMLVPIAAMGMPNTLIKYYPDISDNSRLKSTYFLTQLIIIIGGNLILIALVYLFRSDIQSIFQERSAAYISYIYVSIIVLISQSLFEQFSAFCRAHLNIILPGYFKEIHLRLINMILIVLYGLKIISFDLLISGISFNYAGTTLILALLTFIKYPFSLIPKFHWMTKKLLKNLIHFGAYVLTLSLGNSVVANLGFLLTSTYLGLEANGVFTTCVYIATIIDLPKRATSQIVSPLYAQFFKKEDQNSVQNIYSRSSLNLFLISALLAIGIFTNLEDLFLMIPKGAIFQSGYLVIILVGTAKVIIMGAGTSGELLIFSDHRNYNLHILWISAILTIFLNVLLIPLYGIDGAGLATLIVVILSTFLRFMLIKQKLGLSPFSFGHIQILLVGAVTFLIFYFLKMPGSPFIRIALRSPITLIFFCTAVYTMKISSEVNSIIDRVFKLLRIK